MQHIEKERNSWFKLFIILLFISGYGLLNVMGSGDSVAINLKDQQMIDFLKILQAISVIIMFILPAVLFAVLWTRSRIHYLGITTRPTLKTMLIGGIGMIMALPFINGLAELNQNMHLPASLHHVESWMKTSEDKLTELTQAFTQGTTTGILFTNLFVVAFLAAISEELFFRSILQKVLIECFKNKHVGVWIGAVLFSAFHMQFYGFLPRMMMGAYLGYLFLWSGSIWPGVFAHFLNNGLAVYVTWLINRHVITAEVEKVGVAPDQWMYVVISAIMVFISLLLIYRSEKNKPANYSSF